MAKRSLRSRCPSYETGILPKVFSLIHSYTWLSWIYVTGLEIFFFFLYYLKSVHYKVKNYNFICCFVHTLHLDSHRKAAGWSKIVSHSFPCARQEHKRGSEGIGPRFLKVDCRWRWVICLTPQPLCCWRSPSTHWKEEWVLSDLEL
jgi:hypothetical protein